MVAKETNERVNERGIYVRAPVVERPLLCRSIRTRATAIADDGTGGNRAGETMSMIRASLSDQSIRDSEKTEVHT